MGRVTQRITSDRKQIQLRAGIDYFISSIAATGNAICNIYCLQTGGGSKQGIGGRKIDPDIIVIPHPGRTYCIGGRNECI